MVPKRTLLILLCTAFLAPFAASAADTYSPDEFFSLDLSTAVLSPKPLGPPTEFTRVPVQASSDGPSEVSWARNVLKSEPRRVTVHRVEGAERVTVTSTHHLAHAHAKHPQSAAVEPHPRTTARARQQTTIAQHAAKPAHGHVAPRRDSPLNAEARDTRIQAWPCDTGGICNWKQPAK